MRHRRFLLFSLMLVAPCGAFTEQNQQIAICANLAIPPETVKTLIERESTRQQIDPRLPLAIAFRESRYGANVNSPAGARGIMQLMPETAARYGVRDVCDAVENIRGGVNYLKDLSQLFDGNIMLIAAAYNAGEGRIFAAGGIPPIPETVNYTALVTNSYFGFQNGIDSAKSPARANHKTGTARTHNDVWDVDANPDRQDSSKQPDTSATGQWVAGTVLYIQ